MGTFSVGSFGTNLSQSMEGFSFTPGVSGPDGSGSPGSATVVTLQSIVLGYPGSNTTYRPSACWVYSTALDTTDDIGSDVNLVASSVGNTDGSAFGSGTYSRSFSFANDQLDPAQAYYVYFDDVFSTNTHDSLPYSGGIAWDGSLTLIAGYSPQFRVEMSY